MKQQIIKIVILFMLIIMMISPGCQNTPEVNTSLEWIHQYNTSDVSDDIAHAINGDTNLYIAGQTTGTFTGNTNSGGKDAFITKYDNTSNLIWTMQFGTSEDDLVKGIAIESERIYVTGSTSGDFYNQSGTGGVDIFISMLDLNGELIWIKQFGSSSNDYAYGISVSDGEIYITGYTYGRLFGEQKLGDADVFLAKLDLNGELIWITQFGSASSDYAYGVIVDESGVYITGTTFGIFPGLSNIGGSDAFVAKYDQKGNQIWVKQFGTYSNEYANSISANLNGVFITGVTFGGFGDYSSMGGADVFLASYDKNGNDKWTQQFGTNTTDLAWNVFSYSSEVYVAGYTYGTFPAQKRSGNYDAYVIVYDLEGNLTRSYQFGTDFDDYAKGVFVSNSGLIVTGSTLGTFPNQTEAKGYDIFVVKLQ